jgi:sporulation protein YlmC with PRC-barrel domain
MGTVISCDVLVGEVVVDRADEVLGELAHLMIDMANGRVTHVVIARGGVLGLGEKLHAIPWSAVTLDAQRQCLVVDIARERIEGAPGFDRSRWPSMSDPAWQRDLEGYYSRK